MRALLCALLAILTISCEVKQQTLLISGDSWGFFLCTHGSLDRAMKNAGITKAAANVDCAVTTRIGLRAENWLPSLAHEQTLRALKNKSVKVMVLSLGGNDLMNHWKKSLNPEEEQQVFNKIINDIDGIVKLYQSIRPDIKILISGYDYPRFTADHPIEEYRKAYEDMESPTPPELNAALIRFSKALAPLADGQSVFYMNHVGLMHYYLGNSEANLPPQMTLAPEYISSVDAPGRVGGDPLFQSSADSMMTLEGIVDAFHLNKYGYDRIADHLVTYLSYWLD